MSGSAGDASGVVAAVEEARFDELVPGWMFVLRSPALRVLAAIVLPSIVGVPLALLADGEALRLGPVLVLSLVAVAAVAGWWPTALAGLYAFVLYWRYGVPPGGSFALEATSDWAALGGMAALVVGLTVLTRLVERSVEDVRRLDEERRFAAREQVEMREDAEAISAQVRAVLALANVLAAAHSVAEVAEATLTTMAVPARPTNGSIAIVHGTRLKVIASSNTIPESIEALERVDLRSSPWLGEVLAGAPALVDDRDEFAARYPTARVLLLYPSGSWAVIPFRSANATGLLSVHYAEPQPLTRHALYFSLIAEILATALERAQAEERQEHQLADLQRSLAERDRIARTLSTTLLPPALPRLAGFAMSAWLVPASADEVAGDFYDVFSVGDGDWVAVLGDVCGKGAEAAAVTSLARYAARVAALADPDPEQIAHVANRALVEDRSDLFCTMVIVRYRHDDEVVEVALAGHPQARLLASDALHRVGRYGTALGLACTPPTVVRSRFERGDVLVLFSDGLVERRPDYGEDELDADLLSWRGLGPMAVAQALQERVLDGAQLRKDDTAVLVIGRLAEGLPSTTTA